MKFKKFFFTNSALVFLSSFPLSICALGLFGLIVRDLEQLDAVHQMWIALFCFVPVLMIIIVLARMESSKALKKNKRLERRRWAKNYSKTAPINNGKGKLLDQKLDQKIENPQAVKAPQAKSKNLFLGIPLNKDSFRPVTDEAIDETLNKLALQRKKKQRGVA